MKRTVILIVSALALLSCGAGRKAQAMVDPMMRQDYDPQEYTPNTLIIMYDEEVGKEPLLRAVEEYHAEIIYDYSIIPGMAIRIPEGADIREAMEHFRRVEGVVSVERDRVFHLTDPVRPPLYER